MLNVGKREQKERTQELQEHEALKGAAGFTSVQVDAYYVIVDTVSGYRNRGCEAYRGDSSYNLNVDKTRWVPRWWVDGQCWS
jgi:hypothetical protein